MTGLVYPARFVGFCRIILVLHRIYNCVRKVRCVLNKMVSIIVPVYNAERYIEECLKSIQAQTWNNLEVLVINDGSTDRSRLIVETFVKSDARFHLLTSDHKGPSTARNKGVEAATGEFLTFIDADDCVKPDFIKKMVEAIGEAELCVSGYTLWEEETDKRTRFSCPDITLILPQDADKLPDYERILGYVAWKLYRRELFVANHVFFPEALKFGEDTICFFKYLSCIRNINIIDDTGYIYRRHGKETLVGMSNHKADIKPRFLAEIDKLYRDDRYRNIRRLISFWESMVFVDICKQNCYIRKRYADRRSYFLRTVDRYHLREKYKIVKTNSKGMRSVKFAVMTHMYLPLDILIRVWGRYRGWDEDYRKHSGHVEVNGVSDVF